MHEQTNTEGSPSIIVCDSDHERLTDLATAAIEHMPAVARELLAEMNRAEVVNDDAVPSNVVRMGSTVTFRSDDGQQRRVMLVFPREADIAQGRISILTPVGAALIGLSKGQSIKWTTRDGRRHELTVVDVEQPAPEAA
jgi:regulator of nucleoside diphosphate kinase